jgi:phenylpyruvate tautomerase PptA (4-oxalocrotonate tautomerase family)
MPLVRIDVPDSVESTQRTAIADIVYQTMVDVLDVPEHDRFQIVTAHGPGNLLIDPTYLGIERSAQAFIVDITLNAGRSVELKKQFYATLAERLNAVAQIRPEDVFVSLTEVAKENWSFGNGQAQYA